MNSLAGITEEYMKRHKMAERGGKIVAGVSGGADSVCLLVLLRELSGRMGFSLRAVHVHHGLRKNADEDEMYVRDLCEKLGVPLTVFHLNVGEYAKQHGMGVEEAGHVLRLGCLEGVCRSFEGGQTGTCRIALAHHVEDCAETVLFHLCRGSRLSGARGILPVSGRIIRPLLSADRASIEAWLKEKKISWREDETNEDLSYSRNFIRHRILPALSENVNTETIRHIAAFAEEAEETERFLEEKTKEALTECLWENDAESLPSGDPDDSRAVLSVRSLMALPLFMQKRVLYRFLITAAGRKKDIAAVHVDALLALCGNPESGRADLPGGLTAVCSAGRLRVRKKRGAGEDFGGAPPADPKEDPGKAGLPAFPLSEKAYEVRTFPFSGNMAGVPRGEYTKWFDYDKIGMLPVFRTRLPGDRIILDAEGRSKKISRLMIDEHIPSEYRDRIVMPAAGDEILWLFGSRMNARFYVGETTKTILEIRAAL